MVINNIKIIQSKIDSYITNHKKVFITSSFQTQSIPLLHMISQIDNTIPIYFIDTGFLFPETYSFKDKIESMFNLNVIQIHSPIPHEQQLDNSGLFYYSSNTDHCCYLNKVLPLDSVLREKDIWINGVRRDQTPYRSTMVEEETHKFDCIVYRPMLDWVAKDIYHYIHENKLPVHPLENAGFTSIGCIPCTHQALNFKNRDGRWDGQQKTECGIHIK